MLSGKQDEAQGISAFLNLGSFLEVQICGYRRWIKAGYFRLADCIFLRWISY
jgi:hypothetical protein